MIINIDILYEYYKRGLLIKQHHPKFDLIVWNYSIDTQYKKKWDDITLQCRGLVTDTKGKIVSPCIPKFFNWGELNEKTPDEKYEIFKKYDGSYISLFNYNGMWLFSSRGSFTSDVAVLAERIFNEKYLNKVNLNPNVNYIYEIIGKSNKIVLDYEIDDLILLTSYNVNENKEIDIYNNTDYNGFNIAEKINLDFDFENLQKQIPNNEEGYVIRFESGFRMKLKGSEYFKLHRLISDFSTTSIWNLLKDGGNIDDILKQNIPDEYYNWLTNQHEILIKNYNELIEKHQLFYNKWKHLPNKKEFAKVVLNNKEYNFSILFNMWDGIENDSLIWKAIKPKFELPNINYKK